MCGGCQLGELIFSPLLQVAKAEIVSLADAKYLNYGIMMRLCNLRLARIKMPEKSVSRGRQNLKMLELMGPRRKWTKMEGGDDRKNG